MEEINVIRPLKLYEAANMIGITYRDARKAMSKNHGHLPMKRLQEIYGRLQEIGYLRPGTPKFAKVQGYLAELETEWIKRSNFASKALEVRRMEELRKQGYTNAEIAKKIGRHVNTVIRWIGTQDPAYTAESKRLAARIKKLKAETQKSRVYQAELERIRQEENEIAEKRRMMEAMQEQARKMLEACASIESEIAGKVIELNGAKAELRRKVV